MPKQGEHKKARRALSVAGSLAEMVGTVLTGGVSAGFAAVMIALAFRDYEEGGSLIAVLPHLGAALAGIIAGLVNMVRASRAPAPKLPRPYRVAKLLRKDTPKP